MPDDLGRCTCGGELEEVGTTANGSTNFLCRECGVVWTRRKKSLMALVASLARSILRVNQDGLTVTALAFLILHEHGETVRAAMPKYTVEAGEDAELTAIRHALERAWRYGYGNLVRVPPKPEVWASKGHPDGQTYAQTQPKDAEPQPEDVQPQTETQ